MPLDRSARATTDLTTTLTAVLESGVDSNPALTALLRDYTAYHVVLVRGGRPVPCGPRLAQRHDVAPLEAQSPDRKRRNGFRAPNLSSFGLLQRGGRALRWRSSLRRTSAPPSIRGTGSPARSGCSGAPKTGHVGSRLQDAFTTWLTSGADEVPPRVADAIDDRLSWQRPKAIVCSVLLAGRVVLSAATWRSLVRRSRARSGRRPLREWGLLGVGVVVRRRLPAADAHGHGQHAGIARAAVADALLRLSRVPR